MKKLILSLFILILSDVCLGNGSFYTQSNQMGSEQKYRIGYSTKYGNSFGQSTVAPNYQMQRIQRPVYTTTNYYSTAVSAGPRRSAQRPFSGNFFEDLTDWWRMNTDSNWPSYVEDDYWEEFLALYPEYEDEARQWFDDHNQHFPTDPDDPMPAPVGTCPIGLFILLCIVYSIHKRKPWGIIL